MKPQMNADKIKYTSRQTVIPVKTGIQVPQILLDARLREHDVIPNTLCRFVVAVHRRSSVPLKGVLKRTFIGG